MTPSTPLEVLEARWNAVKEATQKIQEVEALCAKAYEQVSQSWEALIDDAELEQVTEKIYTVEMDFNKLKVELKKLPLVEKMSKATYLKILQQ